MHGELALAARLGIGMAEPLRKWVRQAQVDDGRRPGIKPEESAELKRLRRENAELRRANEILHHFQSGATVMHLVTRSGSSATGATR